MIDLTNGKLSFGENSILAFSSAVDLRALTEAGLVEKRDERTDGAANYYAEAEQDGMRFSVLIEVRDRQMDSLALRWLDSPMKGWDDVSDDALRDEYRRLLNFVRSSAGRPDAKSAMTRTWRFKWGQVEVSYEPRSFDAAIFIKPKRRHLIAEQITREPR